MPKCEQCGAEVELPFECNYCRHYFCVEHRLPENHNCPNQPARTPLGSWQMRKEIASVQTKGQPNKFISHGDYHFEKETSEMIKPKAKKHFPVKKIAVCLVLFIIILFFVVFTVYATYQVQLDVFNVEFDKGTLVDFIETYYWNGKISFNVRFTNKAFYPIKISNFDFKLIIIDEEFNEKPLGYDIFTVISQIPSDMLPELGKGVTLSSKEYKQFKISTSIPKLEPVNFKTIKILIDADVSCIWFPRHLTIEYPVASS